MISYCPRKEVTSVELGNLRKAGEDDIKRLLACVLEDQEQEGRLAQLQGAGDALGETSSLRRVRLQLSAPATEMKPRQIAGCRPRR